MVFFKIPAKEIKSNQKQLVGKIVGKFWKYNQKWRRKYAVFYQRFKL
jgi:hypothetical protein